MRQEDLKFEATLGFIIKQEFLALAISHFILGYTTQIEKQLSLIYKEGLYKLALI
jgi:hypothetical protein